MDSLPFNIAKHLCVSEELAEVDMEHVSGLFNHDVVIMSVPDT